jgi:hypothetical protein
MGNATPPVKSLPWNPFTPDKWKYVSTTKMVGGNDTLISCNIVNNIFGGYVRFVPGAKHICKPNLPGSPAAVALYIGAITEELGQIAKANGLHALGYILDMARLEADQASKFSAESDRWAGDPAKSRRSS